MRTNTIGPLGLLTLAVLVASTWLLDVLATVFPEQSAFLWIARQQGLNLSGLLSIVFMSLTMFLAVRPAWLEKPLADSTASIGCTSGRASLPSPSARCTG